MTKGQHNDPTSNKHPINETAHNSGGPASTNCNTEVEDTDAAERALQCLLFERQLGNACTHQQAREFIIEITNGSIQQEQKTCHVQQSDISDFTTDHNDDAADREQSAILEIDALENLINLDDIGEKVVYPDNLDRISAERLIRGKKRRMNEQRTNRLSEQGETDALNCSI